MKRKGLILLVILAGAVVAWGQSTTDNGFSATRQAGAGRSGELTSQTAIVYAFGATSDYEVASSLVIANGTGAFLYLQLWPSATTGTCTNTDFHLTLKTSETLILSKRDHPEMFPVRSVGVYQIQADDPSSLTLQIRAYR